MGGRGRGTHLGCVCFVVQVFNYFAMQKLKSHAVQSTETTKQRVRENEKKKREGGGWEASVNDSGHCGHCWCRYSNC